MMEPSLFSPKPQTQRTLRSSGILKMQEVVFTASGVQRMDSI